jgi:exonuclease VII large subunit
MPASRLIIGDFDRITFALSQLHEMSEEAQRHTAKLSSLLTAAQSGDPHRYLSAGIDHGMQAIYYSRRATAELNEAVTLAERFLRSIADHDRKVWQKRVFEELNRLRASASIPIALYYRDKLNQFVQQASQHCETLSRYMQHQWQGAAETFTRGMQLISDEVNLLGDSLRQLIANGQAWLTQVGSDLPATMLAELHQQQEELHRSTAEVQAMVNDMLHDAAQQVQAAINKLQQAALEFPNVIGGIIVEGSGLYFSIVSTLQKLMDQVRQLGEDFAALVAQAKITTAGLVAQLRLTLQRVRNAVHWLAEQLCDFIASALERLIVEIIVQINKLISWIAQVAKQIAEWVRELVSKVGVVLQILVLSDLLKIGQISISQHR